MFKRGKLGSRDELKLARGKVQTEGHIFSSKLGHFWGLRDTINNSTKTTCVKWQHLWQLYWLGSFLAQFSRAAITKSHKLRDFKTTEMYCLKVMEARSLEFKVLAWTCFLWNLQENPSLPFPGYWWFSRNPYARHCNAPAPHSLAPASLLSRGHFCGNHTSFSVSFVHLQ